jgi:hypothetical protein
MHPGDSSLKIVAENRGRPGGSKMTNSFYLDASVVSEQRRDRLQAAETKLMLQQSGMMQRGWLVRQICTLVCGAGRLMIAVGEMLVVRGTGSITASVARQPMTESTAPR